MSQDKTFSTDLETAAIVEVAEVPETSQSKKLFKDKKNLSEQKIWSMATVVLAGNENFKLFRSF